MRMLSAILSTLSTMLWLGVVLGILVLVNTVCGTIKNVSKGEAFSFKKLVKGLGKAGVYYVSAALVSVAFTMLPYINEMITTGFGVMLLSTDLLNTLSSVAVLGVVVATVIEQGKKALQGVKELSEVTLPKEEITWKVEEE